MKKFTSEIGQPGVEGGVLFLHFRVMTSDQRLDDLNALVHIWNCFGAPTTVGGHWRRIALGFPAFHKAFELDDSSRRRAFLAADRALADAGSQQRSAVLRAAVFLEPPRSLPDLLSGLQSLVRHFKGDHPRARSERAEVSRDRRRASG